jgi:hypothetical protein
MYIRRKKNTSGSTSIVIIKKVSGKNKVIKTVGNSHDEVEIEYLYQKAFEELERQLNLKGTLLSPEKVIDILKTIYKIEFETPFSTTKYQRLILKTEPQRLLVDLFNLKL